MKNKTWLVIVVAIVGLLGIVCCPISRVRLLVGAVTLLVGVYGIKADLLSTLSLHSDVGLGEYLGKVSFMGTVLGVLEIFAGCL